MNEIIKDVDKLFDTALANIKFFRKFLVLLRNVCFEIRNMQTEIDKLNDENLSRLSEISDLKNWNRELLETLQTLEQTTNPPKPVEPNYRTSVQIMTDRYNAYYDQNA